MLVCVPAQLKLLLGWTGTTQDELSSMVEASIKESKISGNDRDVAWDGATMGGQDLQNQVWLSPACKYCMPGSLFLVAGEQCWSLYHPQGVHQPTLGLAW